MSLPTSVSNVIEKEIQGHQTPVFKSLIRREGAQPPPPPYDVLPKERWAKILDAWYSFHDNFHYSSFDALYSKSKFCSQAQAADFLKNKDLFLYLLADRRFLFLEFNEHLNSPDYPPLSEIVKDPQLHSPDQNTICSPAQAATCENALTVRRLGFVPTYSHAGAYHEMIENFSFLARAIELRKEHRARNTAFPDSIFSPIPISPFTGELSDIEKTLGQLFKDYLTAVGKRAYVSAYKDMAEYPESNYLPAIHWINSYIEEHTELEPYRALVFFHLFSQRTTKLAGGSLKEYKFTQMRRPSPNKPPQLTQDIARRKIEHNIMLFDYLLQLFPSENSDYAKYQFYVYTKYSGYTHFDISNDRAKERFLCLPDPKDGVDQLGSAFRHHIFYCIPNYVSWLTPGLPNNRAVNSDALATLLLRDAAFLPVYTRLTDRVRRCLKDSKIGPKLVSEYQAIHMDQRETIERLNQWCSEYRLEFIGEDIFTDLEPHPEKARQLCSRFVLEHALKEHIFAVSRKNLSQIAQSLFGDLCLDGESFDIPER